MRGHRVCGTIDARRAVSVHPRLVPAARPANSSPHFIRSNSDIEARLGALVERTAAAEQIPDVRACLLRVASPELQPSWSGAAGTADAAGRRLLVPTDSFRTASVTKMMTATTLLQVVEDKGIALDEPVIDLLEVSAADLLARWNPSASAITLRQVLDHTSGLPDYFTHDRIRAALLGAGGGPFTPNDLIGHAAESPLSFHPGDDRQYSDTGFVVAGLVIEALTGIPLARAFRTQLFDPLGMHDTWLEGAESAPETAGPISWHHWRGRDMMHLDPTVDWAGGGLVSTSADLATFVTALIGDSLLSHASWKEMTAWRPGPTGYYDDYGLGLGRYVIGDHDVIGHHGIWGGFAFAVPTLEATITGTVNTGQVDRRPILAEVVHILEECL